MNDIGYRETEVMVEGREYSISGTVCLPTAAGRHPAVVLLHGTGSDRNEVDGAYRRAAHALAEDYGIASIRIDLAGFGASPADTLQYSLSGAAEDAVAAADYMAGFEEIDGARIGVLGWSQGGTVALLAAGRHPERFRSVVTWAGAPDLTILLSDADIAEAERDGSFTMRFEWRESVRISRRWCREVLAGDVPEVFRGYTGPVLAIAGTRDSIVDPAQSRSIISASSNGGSRLCMLEGADHIFNVLSGDMHAFEQLISATGTFLQRSL